MQMLLWQMTVASETHKCSSLLLRRKVSVLGHSPTKVWVLLPSNEQRKRLWIRSCLTACVDDRRFSEGLRWMEWHKGGGGLWQLEEFSEFMFSLCLCDRDLWLSEEIGEMKWEEENKD